VAIEVVIIPLDLDLGHGQHVGQVPVHRL